MPKEICSLCIPVARVVAFLNANTQPQIVDGVVEHRKNQNEKRKWVYQHCFGATSRMKDHYRCLLAMKAGI
jgi:hypothetical protein